MYAEQQRFFEKLKKIDNLKIVFGRLEKHIASGLSGLIDIPAKRCGCILATFKVSSCLLMLKKKKVKNNYKIMFIQSLT